MSKVEELAEFFVIGLAERTSNRREISGQGIIGRQWARLYAEGLLQQIPNRIDNDVIAVYADYAGDHTSEYTFLLGARVSSIEQVPKGMIGLLVAFPGPVTRGSRPSADRSSKWLSLRGRRYGRCRKGNWEESARTSPTSRFTAQRPAIHRMRKSAFMLA